MMKLFRYSTIAAAFIVPFFLLMGCAGASWSLSDILPGNGPRVVGTDIAMKDITEFYYTYATSTYPPDYQRYRFYVKDGAYMFYHEKREGDHWPLRETDITVSGTKELSQEEWKAFFNCIRGGKVEKRKERIEDGGSGPWLFLYWKGDKSEIQEFNFANWNKKTSFEEMCVKLARDKTGNN